MRRLFACVPLLCLAPAAAWADGLVIPGLGAPDYAVRPSYREAYQAYPPEQHNVLGQPVPPPSPYDRPSYQESYNAFPPVSGRYGGGFIEYVMTGGRPGPAPQAPAAYQQAPAAYETAPAAYVTTPAAYAAPAPATAYNPVAASLPRSGLPEYAPDQPAAGYGLGPQSYAAPALPAPQLAYNAPTSAPGATYDPAAAGLVAQPMSPVYYRQAVAYAGRERPGTIVIDTPNKFLYLVQPRGQAIRYGIGVGRPGFAWAGVKTISRKAEWPGWTPPREMLARRPDLPRHMDGGEANPLGARALYLGSSMYRIHGTNEPTTIGTNVSSGCIRMMNQDVIDLYQRVGVGTRVVVM